MKDFKKKFADMSIKKKLLVSHGFITISTFITIVCLLISTVLVVNNMKGLFEGPTNNTFYIGDVRYGILDIQRAVNRTIAGGEEDLAIQYPKLESTMTSSVSMIQEAFEVLEKGLLTQKGRDLLAEMRVLLADGAEARPTLLTYMKEAQFDLAMEYYENTYEPIMTEFLEMSNDLDVIIMDAGENYYKDAQFSANMGIVIGMIILVIVTGIAIKLTAMVTEGIAKPVEEITEVALLMRQGNLNAADKITYKSKDELGVLADAMKGTMKTLEEYVVEISEILEQIASGDLTKNFNEITEFLGEFGSIKKSFVNIIERFNITLKQISEASSEVDSGSSEIARAADELSTGTTEQASAIEELTATVETVSSMAEQSARQTEDAYVSIQKSVTSAQEERRQMEQLQEEMLRIKEISNEIEKIITTIEDIASQTSLLSLNASIEAARAGDAGRGFAVVADQIGKLATDSANAAVTTKELIEKTIEEIDKGNRITGSTAVAFEKIIKDMQDFAELAKTTSETARGQALALEQIEEGIEQISTVTEANAAAAEESSAISEELAAKAEELDNQVKFFKIFE